MGHISIMSWLDWTLNLKLDIAQLNPHINSCQSFYTCSFFSKNTKIQKMQKYSCNPWKIEKHLSEEDLYQQLQDVAYEI